MQLFQVPKVHDMQGYSCYRSVARNFRVVQWLKFNDDMVIIGSVKCIE